MADQETVNRLRRIAAEIRLLVVKMVGPGKAHHFGCRCQKLDLEIGDCVVEPLK